MEFSNLPNLLPCIYLTIHSLLVWKGKGRARSKLPLLAVNLLIGGAFLFLAFGPWSLPQGPPQRYQRFAVLWSPIIFFWWAYLWAGHTLQSLHPAPFTFDRSILALETRLFHQPALHWARRGNRWLSELLHAGYFSYYFYTLAVGAYLHATGRIAEFQEAATAVMIGYLIAYTAFALVPVAGPRWALVEAGLLRPAEQRVEGFWFTAWTQRLLFDGPAHQGGAMPSSHTSTAVIFAYWCFQIGGFPIGLAATLLALSMAAGAVYGRYHYLLDILAGAVVGAGSIWIAQAWLPA